MSQKQPPVFNEGRQLVVKCRHFIMRSLMALALVSPLGNFCFFKTSLMDFSPDGCRVATIFSTAGVLKRFEYSVKAMVMFTVTDQIWRVKGHAVFASRGTFFQHLLNRASILTSSETLKKFQTTAFMVFVYWQAGPHSHGIESSQFVGHLWPFSFMFLLFECSALLKLVYYFLAII